MIEDKLTHDERLRLECIAQAVQTTAARANHSAEQVLAYAMRFEAYIRDGKE